MTANNRLTLKSWLASVAAAVTCATAGHAAEPPAVPQAETSDVATLKPLTPRRVFLWSGFSNPGVFIVDGDSGDMEGYIPKSEWANFATAPGGKHYYVAESIWTRDTRGERQDLIAVYDGTSLNLTTDIVLPGRAMSVPKPQSFALSESGNVGYVYNMSPASSVVVVDLVKNKSRSLIETPGCALVLPYGENGFDAICGNGSLSGFAVDAKGRGKLQKSTVFFDPVKDPVFDALAVDVASRKAFFVSYHGQVYEATLGDEPHVAEPWSLQASAGVNPPKDESGEVAWRPGGSQLLAYHRASNRLYVLMHAGEGWSQKREGTEIWVLDAGTHMLVKRISLKEPATNVTVSQDATPVLFITGRGPNLVVVDPQSGQVVRTVDHVGGGATLTGMAQ
jgi:methylamine dehydrogenase heavy chain